ncbi:DNA-binding MarR family transcriptional regulator [Oerskovia enterophila]
MRIGRPRRAGIEYRGRDERPLTRALPSSPAAVRIYGDDGTCRALCLDLDVAPGGRALVDADALRLATWLTDAGARIVTDISPSGGRHIYVPLARPIEYRTAREIVEALATMYPSLDASPHRSLRSGCIRTPGAAHKAGGHQQLTMTLSAAVDVLMRGNSPRTLERIRAALTEEIAAWRVSQDVEEPGDVLEGQPQTRVHGLGSRLTRIARDGIYDASRYPSDSEARQAVLAGAARARWTLADVAVRLEDGRWPGLAGLYARYSPNHRRKALTRDWHRAQALVGHHTAEPAPPSGNDTVHRSNTSAQESQGGTPPPQVREDEHGFIRTWRAALRISEQAAFPGRRWYGARFLLRALGEAAHKAGTRYIAFGTRSLAVSTGLDHSTVSVLLHQLTAAGWIDRVEEARGENADLYALTLPQTIAETAPGLRWDKGKAHALRPAFRELGHVPALVFEAVEQDLAHTVSDLVTSTGISRRAVHDAVDLLIAWGLLERTAAGLLPHAGILLQVAEHLGVLEAIAAQLRRYATQRATWQNYLARHDDNANPREITDAEWWWPPDDAAANWTLVDVAV